MSCIHQFESGEICSEEVHLNELCEKHYKEFDLGRFNDNPVEHCCHTCKKTSKPCKLPFFKEKYCKMHYEQVDLSKFNDMPDSRCSRKCKENNEQCKKVVFENGECKMHFNQKKSIKKLISNEENVTQLNCVKFDSKKFSKVNVYDEHDKLLVQLNVKNNFRMEFK